MVNIKIKKIFVLGCHRSGTTWLTNIISGVDQIYTPVSDLHHGQIESAFFSSIVPYFNNGRTSSDKIAMYAAYSRSDFYSCLGLEYYNFSTDTMPYEFFSKSMDLATKNHECDTWIEKTPAHSLVVDELYKRFPESFFIIVKRDIYDQALSNSIGLLGGLSLKNLFYSGIVSGIYDNILNVDYNNTLIVNYSDLQTDIDCQLSRILEFVGLHGRSYSIPNLKPNSSFSAAYSNKVNRVPLSFTQKSIVKFAWIFTRFIPRGMVISLLKLKKKIFRNSLPSWLYASKYNCS
jgi:hypothetical protein